MAGTATIGTLSDGTNTGSTTDMIKGSARAWVNFVGATGAISSSFNVSSITRNGTGDYSVNITNALADANYYFGITCPSSMIINSLTTKTSSLLRFGVWQSASGGVSDPSQVNVAVFR